MHRKGKITNLKFVETVIQFSKSEQKLKNMFTLPALHYSLEYINEEKKKIR